ncbi:MAG: T9SS type A sorting domain-containing protein [Flavobacteriales bacterium]
MKYFYLLFSIITIGVIAFFLTPEKTINFNRIYKMPSESSKERKVWNYNRLVNSEGQVPRNIRRDELRFAQSLPNDLNNSNLEWTAEGPYNVGGRTRALAYDVLDENILIAGGASGGIWRSTNLGQSWQKMTKPNQLHNVTCIVQDTRPGMENKWYYGTGELAGNSASGAGAYFDGNGIYKSTNNGLSWDSIASTSDNNPAGSFNIFDFAWNLKIDPSNLLEDEIYLATYGGIHRSIDGGDSWNQEVGNGENYYTNVEVTPQGTVYATLSSDGSDKGFWRSDDGIEWSNITPELLGNTYGRTAIAVNPSNENEVYFLSAETTNSGQFTNTFFGGETWTSLWKYTYLCGNGTDSCGTWVDLSSNIPANRPTTFDNFNAQGGYDLLIKVKPDDPNVVFIGGTNLWRSTDGFTSDSNTVQIGGYAEGSDHGYDNWEIYSKHHPDQHELLFLPSNPNKIINGNDGGIYYSSDCMATPHYWEALNNGYQTTQLYSVTQGKGTSHLIIGGFQDNGNFVTVSEDETEDWVMPFNGDGCYSAVADNEEDFYLQIQRGVLFKMKLNDQGEVLAYNRMDPLGADTFNYDFINYLAMDPNNDDIIYFNNQYKIWRNNDASNYPYNNSLERTNIGWEVFSDTTNRAISCIDVSTSPANIVYLGTDDNYVYRIDNAHEGDPSLTQLSSLPIGFGNKNVSAVEIDPTNADRVLVLISNYSTYSFLFTDDGGQNWKRVGGNLEEFLSGGGNGPSMRTAEIAVLGNDTLYIVGGSTGLYATDKLEGVETEWRQIGTSTIGNVVVENIRYRDSDGKLVVGTHGAGVFSTKITSIYDVFPDLVSVNEQSNDIIYDIYPNPTSNKLTISLMSSENKTILIRDISGKIVFEQNTNNTNLVIDVQNWNKGTYFMSITTEKMIVVTEKLVIN